MFGGASIKLDKELLEKVKKYAKIAGYSSPEEFVTHALEKEIAKLEESDSEEDIRKKVMSAITDPEKIRMGDPGHPDICPVWQLHEVYSTAGVKDWVRSGCTSAGIGCLDCKQPIIDSILAELEPLQARAQEFQQNPARVRTILNQGTEAAREVARETLEEVRRVMGLGYA